MPVLGSPCGTQTGPLPVAEGLSSGELALPDPFGKQIRSSVAGREGQDVPRPGERKKRRRNDPHPRPRKIPHSRTGQRGEVGEIVGVVEFEVEKDSVGRRERKERVGVFARLREKDDAPADAE